MTIEHSGNRDTGKTHRMLMDAVKWAREGKRVVVVVHSTEFAQSLAQRVLVFVREPTNPMRSVTHHIHGANRIVFQSGGSIQFAIPSSPFLVWTNGRPRIMGDDQTIVMMDHYLDLHRKTIPKS